MDASDGGGTARHGTSAPVFPFRAGLSVSFDPRHVGGEAIRQTAPEDICTAVVSLLRNRRGQWAAHQSVIDRPGFPFPGRSFGQAPILREAIRQTAPEDICTAVVSLLRNRRGRWAAHQSVVDRLGFPFLGRSFGKPPIPRRVGCRGYPPDRAGRYLHSRCKLTEKPARSMGCTPKRNRPARFSLSGPVFRSAPDTKGGYPPDRAGRYLHSRRQLTEKPARSNT